MAIYIDTAAQAKSDWADAYADIMARYTPGPHREAVISAARNAYGERINRAFDAERLASYYPICAGKNVYDTDAQTYAFADPADGYRLGYSAFAVYKDGLALIVQELGDDGRLHPVARRASVEA